ncbi:MAG: DEAD/DEAH box helicase [Bacteroidetes bacterium]|nr:DEAD/DEAH box helicase [Bacteroidota bacterium]
MHFHDFKFEYDIQDGLDDMGFTTPTPIQEQAIPIILDGYDLIGCAQTGTGKTAAFLLPVLNHMVWNPIPHTDTLVIVPTRELALQIYQALQGFTYHTKINSQVVYGGTNGISFEQEKRSLEHGAQVVIGTPGRLIAHLNMGNLRLEHLRHLILDEADRMLDMGFVDDIMKIISKTPKKRQTLLFSATMPPKIRQFAAKLLHEPKEISLSVSKPAAGVTQGAYLVNDKDKNALAVKILNEKKLPSVIIFTGRKIKAKELERDLRKSGVNARSIHSDLDQKEREEVLREFRSRKLPVLVATDVLSRGIDIEDIGMVINFDVPGDAEDYIHRIGRTARAESKGEAYTFITGEDMRKFNRIEQLMESVVPKLTNPQGIPAGPEYNPAAKSTGKPKFSNKNKPKFRKK